MKTIIIFIAVLLPNLLFGQYGIDSLLNEDSLNTDLGYFETEYDTVTSEEIEYEFENAFEDFNYDYSTLTMADFDMIDGFFEESEEDEFELEEDNNPLE